MLSDLKFERRVRYEKRIETEEELLSFINNARSDKSFFYRGLNNSQYLCVSSFYRYYYTTQKPKVEAVVYNKTENAEEILPNIDFNDFHKKSIKIIDEFNKQLVISGAIESELSFSDACTLAQHYELPTNLIDFTFNPLVALFFACSGSDDTDAAVFESDIYNHVEVINGVLQHGVSGYYKKPDEAHRELIKKLTTIDKTVEFPLRTPTIQKTMLEHNARIQLQSGVFVYNLFEKPYDIVMYNFWDEPYSLPGRTVYVINRDLKPLVRVLLDKRDISWASLMPEEDGKKIKMAVEETKRVLSIPARY